MSQKEQSRMKHVILLLVFLSSTSLVYCQQTISITSEGRERSFILYRPQGDIAEKLPVVLSFHGFTQTAQAMMNYTGFNALADTHRFMVVYPNGLNFSWNIGQNQPGASTANDVQFTLDIIDFIDQNYSIDNKKIYATGFSNGGFFSFRLACELSDVITAIAPVAATINPIQFNNCNLSRAVPLLQIHGTSDFIVSYNGSQGFSSVQEAMTYWVEKNDCEIDPKIIELPDKNTGDNSTVTSFEFSNCEDDIQVIHYRINNGGHTWPSSTGSGIGNTNRDISSEDIWFFFNKYSLSDPNMIAEDISDIKELFYPNPVQDDMLLILGGYIPENGGVYIYDISGRLMLYKSIYHSNNSINMSHLQSGTYFYRVVDGRREICKGKVIKM